MNGSSSDNVDELFSFGGLLDSSMEEIEGLLHSGSSRGLSAPAAPPGLHTSSPPRAPVRRTSGSEGNISDAFPNFSRGLDAPAPPRSDGWVRTGGLGMFSSDTDLLSHLRVHPPPAPPPAPQDRTGRCLPFPEMADPSSSMDAQGFNSDKAAYLRYLEEQQRLYTSLLEKERKEGRDRWPDRQHEHGPGQRTPAHQQHQADMPHYRGFPKDGDGYGYHSGPPQRNNYRKATGPAHPPPAGPGGYPGDGRYLPQHGPPPHHYGMRGDQRGGFGPQGTPHRTLPRSHTWSNGSRTAAVNGGGERGPAHPTFRTKSPQYHPHGAPDSGYWRNNSSFESFGHQKGAPTGGLKILVVNMRGCLRTYAESGGGIGVPPVVLSEASEPPSPAVISAMEASNKRRAKLYDLMSKSAAHIILMVNSGCAGDDDLKTIRTEVKSRFKTESAMWASFCSPADPPCPCVSSPAPMAEACGDGASQDSRGTGVLILGPLAPRAGWVRSDGESSFSLNPSLSDISAVSGKSPLDPKGESISNINAISSSDQSSGSIAPAHGLKYTLATVRIKAGYSDVVFVSCELPLPLPSCTVKSSCRRVAQWRTAVSELAGILFEEQKKGKNVFLCGRVIPSCESMKSTSSTVTHVQYLKEFLEIMVKGGVFLIVVTHNGAVEINGGTDAAGDMGQDGVSVFFSAGTMPQQQHLAPVRSGAASSKGLSVSTTLDVAAHLPGKTPTPKNYDSDSSIAEILNEDDLFAQSPKGSLSRAHGSPKPGLNANAAPYTKSFTFSKSDIGEIDEASDSVMIKGSYSNTRPHLLNLNGPCPHDSFIRSIKCGVMNISDHVVSDSALDPSDLGTALELNVEIKGWPRKTFEFVSHRAP